MRLLIQPGDGLNPIIKAIQAAKTSVQILIFRCDRAELERALTSAVARGVEVHALIAHTNRSGEPALRRLEQRLLGLGVTVSRTGQDLVRYHGKILIVDHRDLYVLGFNFTYVDTERSRSFGILTTNRAIVEEAERLFESDAHRRPYDARLKSLIVSPSNARRELGTLIKEAKRRLLIYDPTISDPAMIRHLHERATAGVDVRILGRVTLRDKLKTNKCPLRLHARAIVCDDNQVFVGSQSLRKMELDSRREIGIVFNDQRIATRIASVFEEDWAQAERNKAESTDESSHAVKVAKKVAKAVTKEIPPLAPVLKVVIREMTADNPDVNLNPEEVEDTVRHAIKSAVKEVVQDAVEEVVEEKEAAEEPVEVSKES